MAAKKPTKKQKKAKDIDVGKTIASEKIKGGARISKSQLIKLQ